MNGVKGWLSILLIVALIIIAGLSHATEREYSVSGVVYHDNEPDLGLSDLWLTALSKQPTLRVLERKDIRAILGELSLTGVNDDSARQVRLGRLLGVEYFAWIKASDEQALMEVVEAVTGRGIASVPMRFTKGHFTEILPKLAEQAVQAIIRPLPALSQAAPSIAFSSPRFSISNDAVQAITEKIIVDLTGYFTDSGIIVLPRRFAADAVQERWRQEKGLVNDISYERKFLGADYILGIAVDTTNRIEFVMVETATGRRVGRKEISMEEAQTTDGLKALKQWAMDRLKPLMERFSVFPPAAVTNVHYAAPEVLKSLYAGMVLHNQGRYIDALPWFEDTKTRKIKFDETDAWIANCYRLAGFPEIAEELADEREFWIYRHGGPTLNAQSEPGVALLGVTAAGGISGGLAERTSMLLIDRLHEATGKTILASEDIAGMRDEYDLLLGLDKVKGTTWRQAPPILLKEAITAHLEPDKTGFRLRLCLIRNCNPTSIYDVVTSLPADHTQWQPLIDKSAKELLSRSSQGSPTWSPPSLAIEEDQRQLLSQLEKSLTPWIYLKALTRNPDLTKYRTEVPWRLGLSRWFLRVLPEGHPERSMLEFTVVSFPVDYTTDSRHKPLSILQKSRSGFQQIADKYPFQLVGLLSRYNIALIGMTPTNYAATQISISKLLPELTRFEHGEADYVIASIRKMDSALRYALGLPDGKPADVFSRCGGLITVYRGLIKVDGQTKWGRPFSDGTSIISFCSLPHDACFQPRTIAQMRVDIEAYCLLRDQGFVPARFLRDIIEKNGPDADLTHYAVVKYFNAMIAYNCGIEKSWPEEDLCVVCPVFADCLQQLIKNEPTVSSSFKAVLWIQFYNRLPKHPIIATAMKKARQVLQTTDTGAYEQRKKLFEESWKVGPLQDSTWLEYCDKKGFGSGVMEHYYPYLNRLHELYDNEVKSHAICRLYCQFGLAFFRAGRYDLAEPLFEQIISWRDYKNRPPEKNVHAVALYLLALLKQRNGDIPSALRLAKEAVDYMDKHPQTQFPLYSYINIKAGNWGGNGNLKAQAAAFIKELRENPKMKFKNPYASLCEY